MGIYFGVDPQLIMSLMGDSPLTQTSNHSTSTYKPSPKQQQLAQFTGVVLADTEDTWHSIFKAMGRSYQEPKIVLFTDAVCSACGHV